MWVFVFAHLCLLALFDCVLGVSHHIAFPLGLWRGIGAGFTALGRWLLHLCSIILHNFTSMMRLCLLLVAICALWSGVFAQWEFEELSPGLSPRYRMGELQNRQAGVCLADQHSCISFIFL